MVPQIPMISHLCPSYSTQKRLLTCDCLYVKYILLADKCIGHRCIRTFFVVFLKRLTARKSFLYLQTRAYFCHREYAQKCPRLRSGLGRYKGPTDGNLIRNLLESGGVAPHLLCKFIVFSKTYKHSFTMQFTMIYSAIYSASLWMSAKRFS
jgi:hypothetical protein